MTTREVLVAARGGRPRTPITHGTNARVAETARELLTEAADAYGVARTEMETAEANLEEARLNLEAKMVAFRESATGSPVEGPIRRHRPTGNARTSAARGE